MPRTALDFEVLSWHSDLVVELVRIFGVGPYGQYIDLEKYFGASEEVDVRQIRILVAKMNNGHYHT